MTEERKKHRHIKVDCQITDNGGDDCSASIALDVNVGDYDVAKFLHEITHAFIQQEPRFRATITAGMVADVIILLTEMGQRKAETVLEVMQRAVKARCAGKDPAAESTEAPAQTDAEREVAAKQAREILARVLRGNPMKISSCGATTHRTAAP